MERVQGDADALKIGNEIKNTRTVEKKYLFTCDCDHGNRLNKTCLLILAIEEC